MASGPEARPRRDLHRRRPLSLAPVARARDAGRVQRRAPLLEARPEHRLGRRVRPAGRSRGLPGPARHPRAGARVARRLDDDGVRSREVPERRGHVGGRVPRVLPRASRCPAFVCAPRSGCGGHRPRDALRAVPDVRGPRVPGLPPRARDDGAGDRLAVAADGGRGSRRLARGGADADPVRRPADRLPRGRRPGERASAARTVARPPRAH